MNSIFRPLNTFLCLLFAFLFFIFFLLCGLFYYHNKHNTPAAVLYFKSGKVNKLSKRERSFLYRDWYSVCILIQNTCINVVFITLRKKHAYTLTKWFKHSLVL